ncbi:MAG: hypothetical protein Q7T89_09990 [Anaerolineales bacterium]|nr:hypothetical protein [Anaerolineales bacterium]
MKMKNVFTAASATLILLLLAACNALKPAPTPASTPTAVVLPATGVEYYFVTNKLLMPITQEQTQAFALNVDGDPQQQPDNKFGEMLTLLTSAAPGLELQLTLDQAVDTGQLVSLHMVKADDALNDTSVSWSIFQGQKNQSAPSFDGSDKFTFDSAAPVNLPIVGSLANGHFTGGPGAAHIQMFLTGQLIDVDLIGVHLEADLSAKGCANGKLGGGVTVDEFRGKLLPAIAGGLNQIIKADNAMASTLLKTFDSDQNGTITIEELENHPLLMIVISPDLDLLDASGKFNPNQDGVKDSYSLGLGFTCVPATFTVTGY